MAFITSKPYTNRPGSKPIPHHTPAYDQSVGENTGDQMIQKGKVPRFKDRRPRKGRKQRKAQRRLRRQDKYPESWEMENIRDDHVPEHHGPEQPRYSWSATAEHRGQDNYGGHPQAYPPYAQPYPPRRMRVPLGARPNDSNTVTLVIIVCMVLTILGAIGFMIFMASDMFGSW